MKYLLVFVGVVIGNLIWLFLFSKTRDYGKVLEISVHQAFTIAAVWAVHQL